MKLRCTFITFFMVCSFLQAQNLPDTVLINIGNKAKVLLISNDLTYFDTLKIDPRLRKQEQLTSDSAALTNNVSLDTYLDEAKRQMGGSFGAKKDVQSTQFAPYSERSSLNLGLLAGVSFVQQSTAPSLQVGLELVDPKRKFIKGLFLAGQGFFFFNKDSNNKSNMDVNYFVTGGAILNRFNRKSYIGFGYLVGCNGDYFSKNTWKIFTSIELSKVLPLMITPELIFDSQFKGVYPSVGIQIAF